MKNIKTRIAAAACAAITAFCGAQAMSASAFNYGHPYSGNTQEYCESAYAMSRNVRMWQTYGSNGSGDWAEGCSWSPSVKAGKMVGRGFTTAHTSNYSTNQTLTGPVGWVRTLANSHYGFEAQKAAWMEIPSSYMNGWTSFRQGDQVILKSGNTTHAVFITYIDGETFYCSELRSGKIRWGVQFKVTNYGAGLKRVSGGQQYTIQYVARPIKEGDANGDSYVDVTDVDWVGNHYGGGYISGTNRDILMAAADYTGNWWLDFDDSYGIMTHIQAGILGGDSRYVMAQW